MAVLIAAGPFTGSAELSYEILDGLLQQCAQADAQALVLIGPFVDTEHPQVRTGSLDATFEQVFATQVRLCSSCGQPCACRRPPYAARCLQAVLSVSCPCQAQHAVATFSERTHAGDACALPQVVERLMSWLQGAGQGRQVLLVPSTRDAHHLACLPQPAFCCEALAGALRVSSPTVCWAAAPM